MTTSLNNLKLKVFIYIVVFVIVQKKNVLERIFKF